MLKCPAVPCKSSSSIHGQPSSFCCYLLCLSRGQSLKSLRIQAVLFSCYFLSLETGDLYPFVCVALLPLACPDLETLCSSWDSWPLYLDSCADTTWNMPGGGKNIKSICLSLSGQLGQFPSPCTTLKADLMWALAFPPPHLFRSKSSHSTESPSLSFLFILPISEWILTECLPLNLSFNLELHVYGCLDLNSHFQLYPFNMFPIFKNLKNSSYIARWNSTWTSVLVLLLSYITLGNLQVSLSSEISFCLLPKDIEDQSVLNTVMPYTNVITPVTLLWRVLHCT